MRIKDILIAILTTIVCGLAFSGFAAADTAKRIEVPAGDLLAAIEMIAKDADVEIVYQPEKLKGIRTAGLSGEFTTREAVKKLLEGTRLRLSTDAATGAMLIALPESVAAGKQAQEDSDASGNALQLAQGESAASHPSAHQAPEASRSAEESDRNAKRKEPSVQEIVVTAQKRGAERLQDVPISVSVLMGEELDKSSFQDVTEALNTMPGVSAEHHIQTGGTAVSVRGVAANGPIGAGVMPVGYYLDSIPFGLATFALAPDANAYDLERVEVLRGPQGTLYGASAQAGVVRVLTNDANLDQFEFKARTSGASTEGGDNSYRADGAINVPLIDGKLGARVAAGYQYLGGWLSRDDAGGPSVSDDNRRRQAVYDETMSNDYDAYGFKVGYEAAGFSIVSMTSYLDFESHSVLDLIGSNPFFTASAPLFTDVIADVFAQEVNINSTNDGAWRWTAGGIYRDADQKAISRLPIFSPYPLGDISNTSESFAVFGELTRLFMDGRFELTGGLRYFEDEMRLIQNPTDPAISGSLIRVSDTFEHVSPRLILTWHPGADTMLYASYAEGFRSGFLQSVSTVLFAPGVKSADPDTLKNYEVGAKGSLWDGRVTYDTALYFMDWQRVQQQAEVSFGISAIINAESASGLGFDFGLQTRPVEGLQLGLTFSWNDLAMDAPLYSAGILLFDKGDRLNFSPEYTAGVSAGYLFPLSHHSQWAAVHCGW